jgi:hypothetical protein
MMMQMPKMASRQQSPQLACDAQGVVTLSQSLQPTIQQIKSNNLFFIFLIWMKKKPHNCWPTYSLHHICCNKINVAHANNHGYNNRNGIRQQLVPMRLIQNTLANNWSLNL